MKRMIIASVIFIYQNFSIVFIGFAEVIETIPTTNGNITESLTTFEGGGQGQYIYPDDNNLIPGSYMRFPEWLTITNGAIGNLPSGITAAFFYGADFGEVIFDLPVHSVSFYYASEVDVTLEAFDTNGDLVASAFGEKNTLPTFPTFGQWDLLGVDWSEDSITRVRITSGSLMTGIDDFSIRWNTSTPVPESSTMLLLGVGLIGMAWSRRKIKTRNLY